MTYKIYVRCPHCGNEQRTNSFDKKSCVYCGYTFTIFPKKGKSRVSKVVGDKSLYLKDVRQWLKRR